MGARRNGSVAKQEFLYYDVRLSTPDGPKSWHSIAYLVVKRTPKYLYVAATPYRVAGQRGHWADFGGERIRLGRASLEQRGYAFVSFADAELYGLEEPLFFTTPYGERAGVWLGETGGQGDCFAHLELTPPYSVEAVKQAYRRLAMQRHPDRGGAATDFMALQVAYRQALAALGA